MKCKKVKLSSNVNVFTSVLMTRKVIFAAICSYRFVRSRQIWGVLSINPYSEVHVRITKTFVAAFKAFRGSLLSELALSEVF